MKDENKKFNYAIRCLSLNAEAFITTLFKGATKEEYLWKPEPAKWCLLEIASHLLDEEKEDFRYRLKHILETPENEMPQINPVNWVTTRNYLAQDYDNVLQEFYEERISSVKWLHTINQGWENIHHHSKLGSMNSEMMLMNWLAHDYLHIRQINQLKYQYLEAQTKEKLSYAGNW